ncbi:HIRAN domain-containing protein [Sphingomonas sp.]|uniref:HIRAN domain-containing protein n=1 Tax=Sphingomonas sp. TaxID=28214 RepID=UPI003B3A0E54
MPITALSLAVVGTEYPNRKGPSRRFEIAMCRPAEPVSLVPEPKNPADPRAVQVVSQRGIVMGYLSAERCGWIGGLLAEGRDLQAVFQEATSWGAVIRVSLDENEPDLPPERAAPIRDPDWWPDEIPPDE